MSLNSQESYRIPFLNFIERNYWSHLDKKRQVWLKRFDIELKNASNQGVLSSELMQLAPLVRYFMVSFNQELARSNMALSIIFQFVSRFQRLCEDFKLEQLGFSVEEFRKIIVHEHLANKRM